MLCVRARWMRVSGLVGLIVCAVTLVIASRFIQLASAGVGLSFLQGTISFWVALSPAIHVPIVLFVMICFYFGGYRWDLSPAMSQRGTSDDEDTSPWDDDEPVTKSGSFGRFVRDIGCVVDGFLKFFWDD